MWIPGLLQSESAIIVAFNKPKKNNSGGLVQRRQSGDTVELPKSYSRTYPMGHWA